jgi:hypothetical protein
MRYFHKYRLSVNMEFDNMKDAREYLGISRSTFKKLLSVDLIKKV